MDYELGRLAEELIEKRYGEKLDAKNSEILRLTNEYDKLKAEKIYLQVIIDFNTFSGHRETFKYFSIDELTEQLKKNKENYEEELKNSKEAYEELEKKYIHDFKNINKFNNLPWYKKITYRFESC